MSVEIPPYCRGVDDERHRSRIAAFGAIRRAAEVARDYDFIARHYDYEWQGRHAKDAADGVRRAIRAAIGSPKA